MWVRYGISDRGGSGRSSLNLSEREKRNSLIALTGVILLITRETNT